jgi:hypothetical protein
MCLLIDEVKYLGNEQLVVVASYFWEKLTDEAKKQWKEEARQENLDKGRTGKSRIRGFWLFATNIREALYNKDVEFFHKVWVHMTLEEQSRLFDRMNLLNDYLKFFMFLQGLTRHL